MKKKYSLKQMSDLYKKKHAKDKPLVFLDRMTGKKPKKVPITYATVETLPASTLRSSRGFLDAHTILLCPCGNTIKIVSMGTITVSASKGCEARMWETK